MSRKFELPSILFWSLGGSAILLVSLLLLFLRKEPQAAKVLPEHSSVKQTKVTNEQTPNRQVITYNQNVPLPATKQSGASETNVQTNDLSPELLAKWQVPIDFYGKTVDQDGKPLSGVKIHFRWVEKPSEEGEKTSEATSDSEGLFFLQGKRGRSLTLWFGKEGYYSSGGGQETFLYSLGPDIHIPDPNNPVVFRLVWKGNGERLIEADFPKGIGERTQLRTNGTPVEIDLTDGRVVSDGKGHLRLQFWKGPMAPDRQRYDWKCQLSVVDGGIIPTADEFAFLAPEHSYQSSLVIDMPSTNENWKGEIRDKFYVRLPDGRYGRIDLYLLAYNGVFRLHSALNPSGSRNLEPVE